MAGVALTLLVVIDVLVAIVMGVTYMDVQDVSRYGHQDLEYLSASFAGFCTNAAFFGTLALVGASTSNHKFVATYKFASVFKFFAGAGFMVAVAVIDDICPQAKTVNWRWYDFAGQDCEKVVMHMEIPLGVLTFFTFITIGVVSKLVSQIREDQLFRAPIVIRDLKPEGAHPSLSPRGREILKWMDASEPNTDVEAGYSGGGTHNPSTGFFYAGGS